MTLHPDLPRNLTAFAAKLRADGYLVGPGEVADALRALGVLDLGRVEGVRDGLRAIFTASPEQRKPFDTAFDAYFLPVLRPGVPQANLPTLPEAGAAPPSARRGRPVPPPERPPQGEPEAMTGQGSGQRLQDGEESDDPAGGSSLTAQYSPQAGGHTPPLLVGGDAGDLLWAATRLVRQVSLGRSRRLRPQPRGQRLDFRRTLRAAVPRGGEVLAFRYLGRPRRNPRFLVVLDASRSMAGHADLLLRYAHALSQRSRRVEVYAFSTELRRLTPLLRQPGVPKLPDLGAAWGGGTRIGESLWRLVRDEGGRALGPDTVVMVLSDGLDVGEPELLARAAHELRRRSGLFVWLNPLLGTPGYQPTARGMAAALPHVDLFADARTAAALIALPDRIRLRR